MLLFSYVFYKLFSFFELPCSNISTFFSSFCIFFIFFICLTFLFCFYFYRELSDIRRKFNDAESYRDQIKFELLELCDTSEESKIEILKKQENIRFKELISKRNEFEEKFSVLTVSGIELKLEIVRLKEFLFSINDITRISEMKIIEKIEKINIFEIDLIKYSNIAENEKIKLNQILELNIENEKKKNFLLDSIELLKENVKGKIQNLNQIFIKYNQNKFCEKYSFNNFLKKSKEKTKKYETKSKNILKAVRKEKKNENHQNIDNEINNEKKRNENDEKSKFDNRMRKNKKIKNSDEDEEEEKEKRESKKEEIYKGRLNGEKSKEKVNKIIKMEYSLDSKEYSSDSAEYSSKSVEDSTDLTEDSTDLVDISFDFLNEIELDKQDAREEFSNIVGEKTIKYMEENLDQYMNESR